MSGRKAHIRLPAALVVAAAIVAGCGDEGVEGTIPADDGNAMLAKLDAVESAVGQGLCDSAQADLAEVVTQINALPDTATTELKDALRVAATNLATLISEDPRCEDGGTTGTTSLDGPEPPPEADEPPPEADEEAPSPRKDEEPPGHEKPKPSDEDSGSGGTGSDG